MEMYIVVAVILTHACRRCDPGPIFNPKQANPYTLLADSYMLWMASKGLQAKLKVRKSVYQRVR